MNTTSWKKVQIEILGSTYFHLCTSRQWFISSTFQCCVPIEWRMAGAQNWCENCGEEKNPCYCCQILYVDFAVKIIRVKWFYFEVKFLVINLPCTLEWPYTEGTWLYCDCFIWVYCTVFLLTCSVVVLTCFVMCGCLCVCVGLVMWWCFVNMYICICCVSYCLYCGFYCFICFVCTSVRTTATEWQLNYS